jgi:hypothetical protein
VKQYLDENGLSSAPHPPYSPDLAPSHSFSSAMSKECSNEQNFKWVAHTLTASQKLKRVKTSQNLSGQFNKLYVNELARVIRGDEIWVCFENPGSAMWVCADVRRPTRPKQLIEAKKIMIWVCFIPSEL